MTPRHHHVYIPPFLMRLAPTERTSSEGAALSPFEPHFPVSRALSRHPHALHQVHVIASMAGCCLPCHGTAASPMASGWCAGLAVWHRPANVSSPFFAVSHTPNVSSTCDRYFLVSLCTSLPSLSFAPTPSPRPSAPSFHARAQPLPSLPPPSLQLGWLVSTAGTPALRRRAVTANAPPRCNAAPSRASHRSTGVPYALPLE